MEWWTHRYNSSDHPIPYYKPEAGRAKAKKIAPQGEAPDLEEAFVRFLRVLRLPYFRKAD